LQTLIGATGFSGVQALEASFTGRLFGWDVAFGLLALIGQRRGEGSQRRKRGAAPTSNPWPSQANGVLFGAANSLYTVDPSTGATTLVGPVTGVSIHQTSRASPLPSPEPETHVLMLFGLAVLTGVNVECDGSDGGEERTLNGDAAAIGRRMLKVRTRPVPRLQLQWALP
jgi:hypothetical protein